MITNDQDLTFVQVFFRTHFQTVQLKASLQPNSGPDEETVLDEEQGT